MGNKIFVPHSFPQHIMEKYNYLPKVGDIIEIDPCFQCSIISAVNKAGPPTTAEIISIEFGVYVSEDQQNISNQIFKDTDYEYIIRGRLLNETSITPYCGHAHGILNAPKGLETIIRHYTQFDSIGTDAKGWLIKNQPN